MQVIDHVVVGTPNLMMQNLLDYLKTRHPCVKFMKLNHDIDHSNTDEHLHSNLYQMTYCPSGGGYFRLPPQSFTTDSSCFYIVNPNELHGLTSIEGSNFQNATCRFEMPGFDERLLRSEVRLEPHMAAKAYGLMCQIQSYVIVADEQSLIRANMLLVEILLILEQGCRQQEQEQFSPLVRQAIGYITEHYQTGMGINAVAQVCGVSASHLSRVFHKETGDTPLAYLHRVRLGYVVEQLFRTNMKIADIAAASGFESTKNLNMAFRKAYQMTPTEFRSKHFEQNPIDQAQVE
tara:strand:+ start:1723 stop:2595 length:873 start_codon:yes stop_codon:yes gene_type:complete